MAHWLHGSFLGESELLSPTVSSEVETALQVEMVTLPGGIVIPKKTLYLVLAVIVVAYFIWKKQQKG